MRTAYAHEALIAMDPQGDVRAPGAAITVALCGHWEHDPPCPLAPHHTAADRQGDTVRLRVLFATAPESEDEVRARINAALAHGTLKGPDGVTTRWHLEHTHPTPVRPEDRAHAERLQHS